MDWRSRIELWPTIWVFLSVRGGHSTANYIMNIVKCCNHRWNFLHCYLLRSYVSTKPQSHWISTCTNTNTIYRADRVTEMERLYTQMTGSVNSTLDIILCIYYNNKKMSALLLQFIFFSLPFACEWMMYVCKCVFLWNVSSLHSFWII